MPLLDDAAIEAGLGELPGWERRGHEIAKTFARADFAAAVAFVDRVAAAAEEANHHPDIDIRWNKVTLVLSTHSAGGLTDKDLRLAGRIESLAGLP
jgi:4a-hydroxytetrahydrobiopterin dehydratase